VIIPTTEPDKLHKNIFFIYLMLRPLKKKTNLSLPAFKFENLV